VGVRAAPGDAWIPLPVFWGLKFIATGDMTRKEPP